MCTREQDDYMCHHSGPYNSVNEKAACNNSVELLSSCVTHNTY